MIETIRQRKTLKGRRGWKRWLDSFGETELWKSRNFIRIRSLWEVRNVSIQTQRTKSSTVWNRFLQVKTFTKNFEQRFATASLETFEFEKPSLRILFWNFGFPMCKNSVATRSGNGLFPYKLSTTREVATETLFDKIESEMSAKNDSGNSESEY